MKPLLLDLDPRCGLPSASSMYRLANCPGSLTLANWVKRNGYFIPRNPWAGTGTLIHHWLALEALGNGAKLEAAAQALNAENLDISKKCADLRDRIVNQWSGGKSAGYQTIIEKRFWYRAGKIRRFSGQPDFILIDSTRNRGLIINYKTGRIEAEPAADNLQLRTEIVLIKAAYPELEEIEGAIDEPLISWESERVQYSGTAFREAEEEILTIVDEATWHPERRVAGPWCAHCPARIYCRESQDYVESALAIRYGIDVRELPRGERGVELWEKIGAAIKLFKAIKDNYEIILKSEPDALPGYTLPVEGRERREVKSAAALKRALGAYLSTEEIDNCATYFLGKVEEIFGKKAGLAGVDRERKFSELIADVIEITRDKPFIRALTKRERELSSLVK